MNRYQSAKEIYASFGVDTEAALNSLKRIPVSVRNVQTGFVYSDHNPAVLRFILQ